MATFLFGIHPVLSVLEKHPERLLQLFVLKDRHDHKLTSIVELATAQGIHVEQVSRARLDQLAHHGNHQGVIADCQTQSGYTMQDLASLIASSDQPPLILVLDGVQDPHNLGACLRTADAAGVTCVIAPKDKSVGITPVVSKVACGAAETVPFIQVTNLVRALEELKKMGIWIYGADAAGKASLFETDLSGPAALVLGAEGEGLRRLTKEHCDVLLHIPMQGTVESLNVSVATGICLFRAVQSRVCV